MFFLRKPITECLVCGSISLILNYSNDVNYDMVDKGIIKTIANLESRMPLHERPNMAVELMRRDKALGML